MALALAKKLATSVVWLFLGYGLLMVSAGVAAEY
jgi:hypothetical protein